MCNKEKIIAISMKIILNAGDARNFVTKSLNYAKEFKIDKANNELKMAEQCINEAHLEQTNLVQSEARGDKVEYSTLFTHAQDSLMITMSEINMAKHIIGIYEQLMKTH